MRLTIYRKFILVIIPVFFVITWLGMTLLANFEQYDTSEALARRIGNHAARIAGALELPERYSDQTILEDFLGTFGIDAAVLCAEMLNINTSQVIGSYPPKIGCKGIIQKAKLSIPVTEDLELKLLYSDAEIKQQTESRLLQTIIIISMALLSTLAAASLGFRMIVGIRLHALHKAITDFSHGKSVNQVDIGHPDELADILTQYNRLMVLERERQSQLLEKNKELVDESRRDALTKLYNRHYFEDWKTLYENNPKNLSAPGIIGLVDLDHFKRINDTYGHAVGDEVLKEVSMRLQLVLREGDIVVRWGGEEVFLYIEGSQDIEQLAERILSAISQTVIETSAVELNVTASLGLVQLPLELPHSVEYLDTAISLADSALYEAKHQGRARAICMEALHLKLPEQLLLAQKSIHEAVRHGIVELASIQLGKQQAAIVKLFPNQR